MAYYLIDFENVKSRGMEGVELLAEEDTVCIFYTQLRHQFKSITDIKLYLISISGLLQPRAGKILLLVINLKCMKHSSLTQAFGKTKS